MAADARDTLTGIAFAWLYQRHGSWAAVVAHMIVNGVAAAAGAFS